MVNANISSYTNSRLLTLAAKLHTYDYNELMDYLITFEIENNNRSDKNEFKYNCE